MPPLVTVVIPAYRAEAFVREAVESVLMQTWRPLELVVIDDASPDRTAEIVNSLISNAADSSVDLRIISHASNLGAAQALDTGFRQSHGEYVAWLSADDMYTEPWKLERQVAHMESSDCAMCYYRDFLSGASPDSAQLVETALVPGHRRLDRYVQARPERVLVTLLFSNAINGSSSMIRRVDYEFTGGFDVCLGNVDADADLWMRFLALGRPIHWLDGAPLFYRVHSAQTSQADAGMLAGIQMTRVRMIRALSHAGRLGRVIGTGRLVCWASIGSRAPRAWRVSTAALAHDLAREYGGFSVTAALLSRQARAIEGDETLASDVKRRLDGTMESRAWRTFEASLTSTTT